MRFTSLWRNCSNLLLNVKTLKINTFKFSVNICDNKCHESSGIMKVLNVAEKNDAAKNIAILLSRGNSNKVNRIFVYSFSLFNHLNITILIDEN